MIRDKAESPDDTARRTYLIVGYLMTPRATADPASPSIRLVGPVDTVDALIGATSNPVTDYVAVQRVPLPDGWIFDAAQMMEHDLSVGAVVVVGPDTPRGTVVFAEAGAAVVVRAGILSDLGGFHVSQTNLDAQGAEADLQWRVSARGYRVVALPVGPEGCFPRPLRLPVRLALLIDNLELDTLSHALAPILLATVTGPLRSHGINTAMLDLQRSPGGDEADSVGMDTRALSGAREVVELSRMVPDRVAYRRAAQATRRVTDRVLGKEIAAYLERTASLAGVDSEIAAALQSGNSARPQLRTLVATSYAEGTPGYERISRLVERLDPDFTVLNVPDVGALDPAALAELASVDVIILEGVYLRAVPSFASLPIPLVVDLSCWEFQEDLYSEPPGLVRRTGRVGTHSALLAETVSRADLVVVSDDDQRDVALGLLAGCGRLNDLVYDEDASLKTLVACLDEAQLAAWCANPRRAADLVDTFLLRDVTAGPTGIAARLTRPLRRLLQRGRT